MALRPTNEQSMSEIEFELCRRFLFDFYWHLLLIWQKVKPHMSRIQISRFREEIRIGVF